MSGVALITPNNKSLQTLALKPFACWPYFQKRCRFSILVLFNKLQAQHQLHVETLKIGEHLPHC